MPTFQNIVLTDATTPTPVNHTFVPQDNQGGKAIVSEAAPTEIGRLRMEITPMFKRGQGRKFLTKQLLVVPIVATETVNGVNIPKIVRTAVVDCTWSFDEQSTEQERKDAIAMFRSSLDPAKPLVYQTLTKVEGIYG